MSSLEAIFKFGFPYSSADFYAKRHLEVLHLRVIDWTHCRNAIMNDTNLSEQGRDAKLKEARGDALREVDEVIAKVDAESRVGKRLAELQGRVHTLDPATLPDDPNDRRVAHDRAAELRTALREIEPADRANVLLSAIEAGDIEPLRAVLIDPLRSIGRGLVHERIAAELRGAWLSSRDSALATQLEAAERDRDIVEESTRAVRAGIAGASSLGERIDSGELVGSST